MQRAVIIVLIVVFGLSTVGMYIAAAGTPPDQSTQQSNTSREQETQRQDSDVPRYLRSDKVNVRETKDATGQSTVTTTIQDTYFTPTVLRISKGTTVTWRNQGSEKHTVTSDKNSPRSGLESGLMDNGDTYQHTFDTPGVYNYYCEQHPLQMKAVIKVVN